ncbi:MAG: hypothetical protein J5776_01960 [Clostridiales bacterium]|nr:hypothetical protein [Clostridiales bacterium]
MTERITKNISAIITGALMLSLTSCMFAGPKKEDIIAAADAFAQALISRDAEEIAKLSAAGAGSDAEDLYDKLFDTSDRTDNEAAFIEAVADTLTYKIDEDSVDAERDEAEVDVVFVMVDYEDALGGGTYGSIDEAVEALEACTKTRKVTVTFEFVSEGGEWLISNAEDDDYTDIFDFYKYMPDIRDIPDLSSLVTSTSVVSGPGFVEMSVEFEEDVQEYSDLMTCDVICGGNLIAEGQPVSCYQIYVWCGYYIDGDVLAGDYTLNLYCDGDLVDTISISVSEGSAGFSGLADPSLITGDTYIGEYDYTEVFADDYLYYEGYAVPLEGTLKTNMYLVMGDGLWKLSVHEDEFIESANEYLEENSTILMASYLGISIDQVDDYAEEIGQDEFDELKAEVFDELVDGFFDGSETVDYGTYSYVGDKLTFSSSISMSDDFMGEFDDEGMLILDISFDSIEFYPEG